MDIGGAPAENRGKYGEFAVELTAMLVNTGTAVSVAERADLGALLEATDMPVDLTERLTVELPAVDGWVAAPAWRSAYLEPSPRPGSVGPRET